LSERLTGYAICFGSLSQDLGGFKERILPSAAERTLRDRGADVCALYEHDWSRMLGRRRSGTLELAADSHGVRASILPPSTGTGPEVLELVGRGDLDGMSFRFGVMPGGESWAVEGEQLVRTISDMIFIEVSVVSTPAYPATSIGVRESARPEGVPLEILRLRNDLAAS